MAKYYTLICREDDDMWYPQFGDYSKATVKQEMLDSYDDYKAKHKRIIECKDDSIEAFNIAMLNAGLKFRKLL